MKLESSVATFFDRIAVRGIWRKLLVFSLAATLIPSLTMGWLYYDSSRQLVEARITEELRRITDHSTLEIDLWLSSRSYELSAGAAELARQDPSDDQALLRALAEVSHRNPEQRALWMLGPDGEELASTSGEPLADRIPEHWLRADSDGPLVGEPTLNVGDGSLTLMMAEPVQGEAGRTGLLVASMDFQVVQRILAALESREGTELYLAYESGYVISTSGLPGDDSRQLRLDAAAAELLFAEEARQHRFVGIRGTRVIGMVRPVTLAGWGVVAEREQAVAYAELARLRWSVVVITAIMLAVVGAVAYMLSIMLVRPLRRLTAGAEAVARGDFDVQLPVTSRNETGYLTRVFNDMVERLRETQDELAAKNRALQEKNRRLHALSITDGLTGLFARKYLSEILVQELSRARRYGHELAVLMIDIDHFKAYNDSYGHPVGDEALVHVSEVYRECLRNSDYAARWGGEEFLLMLPETGPSEAVYTAERIRRRVAESTRESLPRPVTVSIGVASFPEHGDDADSVIEAADEALYRAKHDGRNRVQLSNRNARPSIVRG